MTKKAVAPVVEEKAAAPKAAPKAEKKTARKTAPRAARVKTTVVLQYQGRQLAEADLVSEAKKLWADAGRTDAIKELNLYVKPEDSAVYCVINGETMGSFAL